MKTLIATVAVVTAIASPTLALSINPQAASAFNAQITEGQTGTVQTVAVRHRTHRPLARGPNANANANANPGGNQWCQGNRDPRNPYSCNFMHD
jgi:hypothetical protein